MHVPPAALHMGLRKTGVGALRLQGRCHSCLAQSLPGFAGAWARLIRTRPAEAEAEEILVGCHIKGRQQWLR